MEIFLSMEISPLKPLGTVLVSASVIVKCRRSFSIEPGLLCHWIQIIHVISFCLLFGGNDCLKTSIFQDRDV